MKPCDSRPAALEFLGAEVALVFEVVDGEHAGGVGELGSVAVRGS